MFPAEWEKQARVWLAWPHTKADWPGKFPAIPFVFAEIARGITAGARLGLIVRHHRMQEEAALILAEAGVPLEKVDFLLHATNRGWLRDCGALFVKTPSGPQCVDFRFNGWAKYRNHGKDDTVAAAMADYCHLPLTHARHHDKRVVLEGGALEMDGLGTMVTTEECLLSSVQCRNPGFRKTEYEQVFADYLGVSHTIWLHRGIVGDDTHGHVDDLTRFVAPHRVVTMVETNRLDPNHEILAENLAILKNSRDAKGHKLDIIELPMPGPVQFQGETLPASYANFLITNGTVLVPVFNDPNDRIALNRLADAMPKHEILPIFARDLVLGLGTIHCLTQQQPA